MPFHFLIYVLIYEQHLNVTDAYCPASLQLPFYLERETVESMFYRLGIEDCKYAFEKQDFGLKLLLTMSDTDLKDTLLKMNLTVGKQIMIINEIKAMKSRK